MTGSAGGSEESYYAAVEDHFVARRGSPLFITPGEWDLVHRWEQLGIPLEVVKEGIDRVFERPRARLRSRKLGYCRQAVEAAFRRFQEARLGGGEPAPEGRRDEEDRFDAAAHRAELAARLRESADEWSGRHDSFAARLRESAALVETAEAEEDLARVEARLLEDCASVVGNSVRDALRNDATASLASYRERMPEAVYLAALESAYRRRLRKALGLPTLSFYTR